MNIKVENLNLNFGKKQALNNVSFEIDGRKIVGLLGRNGAGKTSLLSIIASYREPSQGKITINGEISFENPAIMSQVSLSYDQSYEYDSLSDLLRRAERFRPHFDKEYANYLVDIFKLDRNQPIRKFSKGMKSSVNAIIGLANRAPITLLDEVYLGMDAHLREHFYQEILKEQERNPRLFILSTHLVSEMDYLFDEVIMLDEGKILVHEEYDTLVSKGVTITGEETVVDQFVKDKNQINTRQLGRTKAVMIYGELTDKEPQRAIELGLDLTPASLHDLFIHLTKEGE